MGIKNLTKIISFVLGPLVLLPLLILLLLLKTGLSSFQQLLLLPILVVFQLIIPFCYFFLLIKLKKISDWNVRKREERHIILLVFLLSTGVTALISYFLATPLFFHLFLIFFIDAVIGTTITFFWKISLHLGLVVTFVVVTNFLFGWQLPFLYFFILPIGWARYYDNHHTVSQIVLGAFLNWATVFSLLSFFGYLK